ncbi:hypothetical protein SLS59_004629 [Nothophoma quercina]|uniref:Uncharacterized protein n=1 Tax=Nothophoma quercina TaxID=749835 RepID=A0ABR3RFB4_9PLEO
MSMNWQLGSALQPFDLEAFHNHFVQNDPGFTDIFGKDSNDLQGHLYFASEAPTMQHGPYPPTTLDELNLSGWSSSDNSASLQDPVTQDPIHVVDLEVLRRDAGVSNVQNAWNASELQTGGISGVGASLSTLPDFGGIAAGHLHLSAVGNSQQPLQYSGPPVNANDSFQFSEVPTTSFDFNNAILNVDGAVRVGFEGAQQLHAEENTQLQDITSIDTPPQKEPQPSKSKTKKPRATTKPSKSRAKKAPDTQQAAGIDQSAASGQATAIDDTAASDETADVVIVPVPEPDANYAFAVTDMNDVYLDPKPQLSFGKHEPHLVPKVAAAQKSIKSHKSNAGTTPPKITMTKLCASIQDRNARIMSQPGPRPQKSQATPTIQWRSPSNDASIPITAFAYGTCLHLLTNAICNRKGCFESENAEFRNRYFDKSTYFPEAAVASLAERILDAMIDVHENGFPHETLDPHYDERYRKTQGFNFRDRFNLVTRILKHSKNTCNELFKNFRVYDVIGGAYDLETRIYSNSLNNKRKANKERERKAEEATKGVAKENKQQGNAGENEQHGTFVKGQQRGTKRSLETGDADNESTAKDNQTSRPNKRVKPTDNVRPPENNPSESDSATEQTSLATTIESSGGPAVVKKVLRRSKNVSVTPSNTFTKRSDDKPTEPRGKKRAVANTDEDKEPAAPPAKKSKTTSPAKAPKKGKAKAKPAPADDAADDDTESAHEEKAPTRRKGADKSASTSNTTRKLPRLEKPVAGNLSATTAAAASEEESALPE